MTLRQYSLRRMFLAVTVAAAGAWVSPMVAATGDPALALFGSVVVGGWFGASVGLLIGRLGLCAMLGAFVFLIVGILFVG
jgi:hypothetical protein